MPDWLVEGDTTVYALLALLGVIFVALWWQSRNRGYAVAAGVVGVLLLGYFLLGSSRRERPRADDPQGARGCRRHQQSQS